MNIIIILFDFIEYIFNCAYVHSKILFDEINKSKQKMTLGFNHAG